MGSDEAGIAIWHWYSLDQARAAATFVRRIEDLEANPAPPNDQERNNGFLWSEASAVEHRSLVIAAIMASVAFLEASINELYASAAHGNLEMGGSLQPNMRQTLVNAGDMLGNNRIIDRFQLTLLLLGRSAFDPGAQPFQDAALLVSLRNDLVHYKPQWRRGAGDASRIKEEPKSVRGLHSKNFPIQPFTSPGNPFFPDRCLGHACAAWGLKSALAFADEFFGKLGVTTIYSRFRPEFPN